MQVITLTKGMTTVVDDEDALPLKWYYGANGYAQRKSRKEKGTYLHRLVMERLLGRPLKHGEYVDHINGNKLDNRRQNLRLSTMSQNLANGKIRSNNTTGVRGVSLDRRNGHYVAHYYIKSKKYHIGSYKTLEEAIKARRTKEIKLYGDFVLVGQPR